MAAACSASRESGVVALCERVCLRCRWGWCRSPYVAGGRRQGLLQDPHGNDLGTRRLSLSLGTFFPFFILFGAPKSE